MMQHNKSRVLIVGGSGFLGKETAKLLKRFGYNVFVADLPFTKNNYSDGIPFIPLDITNSQSIDNLEMGKNDIIIDLASKQYHDKVPYFKKQKYFDEVNLYGAINLMNKAINSSVGGYIFFSSDMVYGIPKKIPLLEKDELNPVAEYGRSKAKAEKALIDKAKNFFPLVIFRPRLIIGPGRLGVFKKLFWFIHKSLPVPIIGSGNNCYQMISVFDCASAILLSIQKGIPNDVFNLGSEKKIKVKNLLKDLIKYASSKSITIPLHHNLVKPLLFLFDSLGMPILYPEQFMIADKDYIVDINKAKKQLEWNPKFDDQQMVNNAYEHWLKLKNTKESTRNN